MSRRTMPLVGLNSCERIRPERLRNPIQRLVWGPGTQFLVGQVGLPEDEGSNPRMALRRYTNIILLLIHARNSVEIISVKPLLKFFHVIITIVYFIYEQTDSLISVRKDCKVHKKIEARCELKIRKNEYEKHKRDTRLPFVSYHKRILKYRQFLINEF